MIKINIWLVVTGTCFFFFHSQLCMECHHPNWRTHFFQRGWNHQPDVGWWISHSGSPTSLAGNSRWSIIRLPSRIEGAFWRRWMIGIRGERWFLSIWSWFSSISWQFSTNNGMNSDDSLWFYIQFLPLAQLVDAMNKRGERWGIVFQRSGQSEG